MILNPTIYIFSALNVKNNDDIKILDEKFQHLKDMNMNI